MSKPTSTIAPGWTQTSWFDEPAWTSVNGSVRAIVSEARCRLMYLGSADGGANLLNAPHPKVPPSADNQGPNQGGHRFWLGPQSLWGWPPPREWEYTGARVAGAAGDALTLHHERFDSRFPEIVREYRWQDDSLRCTASWCAGDTPWFGVHIIPVDTPFSVTAQLLRSPNAPRGFVNARMIDDPPAAELPHPAVSITGNLATVSSGHTIAKLGFAPQALRIARPGGWTLSLNPAPGVGTVVSFPDHGYLSQVWVGTGEFPLAEIEQLSPCMTGDERGCCASTVLLTAVPPPSQSS